MLATIAVCMVLITLMLAAVMAALFLLGRQLRHTALALEALSHQARHQLAHFQDAADKMKGLAGILGSNWVRALATGAGVAATFWARRRGRPSPTGDGHGR